MGSQTRTLHKQDKNAGNKNKMADTGGKRRRSQDVDRGYAWVVLCATYVVTVLINGYLYNNGIYFVIFLHQFGESRASTAWIMASQGICLCIAGPVASLLLPRLGVRLTMILGALITSAAIASMYFADSILYLIVTFGLGGFGGTLVLTSGLASIAVYFDKYLYLASGLTISGVGVGIMLIGIETEWVVAYFGWKGSMLIQAGLILQIVVCGSLIFDMPRPLPGRELASGPEVVSVPEAVSGPEVRKPLSTRQIFGDPRFILIMAGLLIYYGFLTILMGLLKDIADSQGMSVIYPTIITCFGIANTLGRALSGFFAIYVHPPVLYFLASSLCSASVAALIFVRGQWPYVLCVAVFAFNNGQQAVLQNLTLSFMFSRQLMAVLFGYSLFLGAIAIVAVSPLVGHMADISGSYDSVLWLTSSGLFTCGTLFLISYLLHRRKIKMEKQDDSPEIYKLNQEEEMKLNH